MGGRGIIGGRGGHSGGPVASQGQGQGVAGMDSETYIY